MARLAINSLSGAIFLAIQIVVSFVLTPIIVHQLGNAAYGAWEVTIAVVSYVSLLELGFGQATLRGIALGRGQGDLARIQATVSSSFAALVVMGLVGGTALLIASPWGSRILGTESHPEIPGTMLLVAAAFMALLQFTITPLAGLAAGIQEYAKLNSVRTVLLILRSASVVWVLRAGGGLVGFAWTTIAFSALQVVLLCAIFRKPLRDWFRIGQISLASVKSLAAFGMKSSVLQSASTAVRSFVPLLISHAVGPASVVYYSLANRLAEYGLALTVSLGTPLMATYAEASGTGLDSLKDKWIQTTRILQFFSLGIPCGLFFFGSPFIGLWMGSSFAEGSYWPMMILSLGLLAQGLATNCSRLITSQDRHGRLATLAAGLAILVLPVTWAAAMTFGITGAASGLAFYLLGLAASEIFLGYRVIEVRPMEGFKQTTARYVVPLGGLALASFACIYFGAGTSYATWIAGVLVSGGVYLLLAWLIAWTHEDRKKLLRLIKR